LRARGCWTGGPRSRSPPRRRVTYAEQIDVDADRHRPEHDRHLGPERRHLEHQGGERPDRERTDHELDRDHDQRRLQGAGDPIAAQAGAGREQGARHGGAGDQLGPARERCRQAQAEQIERDAAGKPPEDRVAHEPAERLDGHITQALAPGAADLEHERDRGEQERAVERQQQEQGQARGVAERGQHHWHAEQDRVAERGAEADDRLALERAVERKARDREAEAEGDHRAAVERAEITPGDLVRQLRGRHAAKQHHRDHEVEHEAGQRRGRRLAEHPGEGGSVAEGEQAEDRQDHVEDGGQRRSPARRGGERRSRRTSTPAGRYVSRTPGLLQRRPRQ
jgi:hypothetical protein